MYPNQREIVHAPKSLRKVGVVDLVGLRGTICISRVGSPMVMRLIPRWVSHEVRDPFLKIGIIVDRVHSDGTFSEIHIF